jgi:hypothetical protein
MLVIESVKFSTDVIFLIEEKPSQDLGESITMGGRHVLSQLGQDSVMRVVRRLNKAVKQDSHVVHLKNVVGHHIG